MAGRARGAGTRKRPSHDSPAARSAGITGSTKVRSSKMRPRASTQSSRWTTRPSESRSSRCCRVSSRRSPTRRSPASRASIWRTAVKRIAPVMPTPTIAGASSWISPRTRSSDDWTSSSGRTSCSGCEPSGPGQARTVQRIERRGCRAGMAEAEHRQRRSVGRGRCLSAPEADLAVRGRIGTPFAGELGHQLAAAGSVQLPSVLDMLRLHDVMPHPVAAGRVSKEDPSGIHGANGSMRRRVRDDPRAAARARARPDPGRTAPPGCGALRYARRSAGACPTWTKRASRSS